MCWRSMRLSLYRPKLASLPVVCGSPSLTASCPRPFLAAVFTVRHGLSHYWIHLSVAITSPQQTALRWLQLRFICHRHPVSLNSLAHSSGFIVHPLTQGHQPQLQRARIVRADQGFQFSPRFCAHIHLLASACRLPFRQPPPSEMRANTSALQTPPWPPFFLA